MTFITVKPNLDEVALSHEGRIAWLNCATSKQCFTEILHNAGDERHVDVRNLPRLHQLALLSGISPEEYARRHSMLPLIHVVSKGGTFGYCGERCHDSKDRDRGMSLQRPTAFCCLECIQADLFDFGFSWYRRIHQVQGADFCISHGTRLYSVQSEHPFLRVPHYWLKCGKLQVIPHVSGTLSIDGFVRRYLEVCAALFDADAPMDVFAANKVLIERAQALGIRITGSRNKVHLSDYLVKKVPEDWARRHWKYIAEKIPSRYFSRIDGPMRSSGHIAAGETYPIAFAGLFESKSDALGALLTARKISLTGINGIGTDVAESVHQQSV